MKSKKVKLPKITEEDILVVKVGSEDRPASKEDIENVQTLLAQASKNQNIAIVTHNLIEFVVIKRALLKNVIVCSNVDKCD